MPSATAGGANLSAYFKLDGSRTITGPTTILNTLAAGAASFSGDVVLDNAFAYRQKDSSGTARNLLRMDGSNVLNITNSVGNISIRSTSGITRIQSAVGALNIFEVYDTGAVANTLILKAGKVGLGETDPVAKLDILAPNAQQVRLGNTASDVTLKTGNIQIRHYTNAEEDVQVFGASSNTTSNLLNIGGGSSLLNAVNTLVLYTAPNNTTTTGTERLRIDSSGNFTFSDGSNFILGTTTGTKIGTAASQKIGAYGVTPVVQPTVTGSRGGNAALASLLTALASIGWIVNSSSA